MSAPAQAVLICVAIGAVLFAIGWPLGAVWSVLCVRRWVCVARAS